MKRRVLIGVLLALLAGILMWLNGNVISPEDYTGLWYREADGRGYTFENGQVRCAEGDGILLEEGLFSGAYSFAGDRAVLFLVDTSGAGEVVQLQLVRSPRGDMLCRADQDAETVWFRRNP